MSLRAQFRRFRNRWRIDEFTDLPLRAKFKAQWNIDVGLYSYGCFDRDRIDPNTTVGRYCSFSTRCFIINRNHGMEFISTTPYLYNLRLGTFDSEVLEYLPCLIGDDVWLGHNATIMPSARRVGRGAVIAGGAVVTKDVAPYAIVAGVPAKEVRKRFTPQIIERIEASRWWEWDLAELRRRIAETPDMVYQPSAYFSARHTGGGAPS